MDLQGKTILITGAAQGLGQKMAVLVANRPSYRPIGGTGAVLTTRLLYSMRRTASSAGIALALENVHRRS
jgi:hypothetical protein